MRTFRSPSAASLVLLAGVALQRPSPAGAQTGVCPRCGIETATPSTSDAALIAVNALLGGTTAGILRAVRGESFLEGFAAGLAGGALVYAGKRVVAQPFVGAGLAGRQLAAFGNTVIRNASDARPVFSEVIVMLGPIPGRLLIATGGRVKVRPQLDLVSLGGLVYGAVSSRYSIDWGTSWSSGAAVFVDDSRLERAVDLPTGVTDRIAGQTVGGNIFLTPYAALQPGVLEHERVHVIQFDFVTAAWGDRVDSALLSENGAKLDRYVKLNLLPAMLGFINQAIVLPDDREGLPWEVEAHTLAQQ